MEEWVIAEPQKRGFEVRDQPGSNSVKNRFLLPIPPRRYIELIDLKTLQI